MRSRVTAKRVPTSSSVWSERSPMPKRSRSTCSSRGVSVASTLRVLSWRCRPITASAGEGIVWSSMKSPTVESSSSPIGVSREIGSLAIFMTRRTLSAEISIPSPISSARGGAHAAHRALVRAERHADLPLDLGQLAACGTDLLGQRGQRLGRDADRAARALQRDPLAGRAIGALGAVREAARQAEQLGRRAAGALLDGLEVRPPHRRPLEAGREPARHVLDLAAREPEPAERAQETRLEAGATLGEPGAPATAMGERARLRTALRGEPPHPPELPEEVPPQPHLLVPRLRLRVLLALVAHQVADPDLARAQPLGEREHVA